MEKAIANGKFVDRLLYWAAEFNVSGNATGWENVTIVPPPDSLNPVFPPNSTYVYNREGKHDKQAKPWEPSHSGPAPHSLDLVSTKEHGDVPEAIRKLEANNDDAV